MTTIGPPENTRRDEILARLFSELQVARFNEIYYQKRSGRMKLYSICARVVAAVSSGMAAASIVKLFPLGGDLIAGLAILGAILSALEFVVHWDEKAAQFEKAALGHAIISARLKPLLSDLKLSEAVDAAHYARIDEIGAYRIALTALDEEGVKKVKEAAWAQALEEIPSENAWSLV